MKVTNFYDLTVWKEGHLLVLEVYKVTKNFPKEEQFGIISQLRRSASSITANIAEGFGRYHYKDKVRFYYQARGSINEVQNFLLLAKDLDYVSTDHSKFLWKHTKTVEKLINGVIRSTEKQQ